MGVIIFPYFKKVRRYAKWIEKRTKSYYNSSLCLPLPIQTFSFTEMMTIVKNYKTLCTLSMLSTLYVFTNRNSTNRKEESIMDGLPSTQENKQIPFPRYSMDVSGKVYIPSNLQPSEQMGNLMLILYKLENELILCITTCERGGHLLCFTLPVRYVRMNSPCTGVFRVLDDS